MLDIGVDEGEAADSAPVSYACSSCWGGSIIGLSDAPGLADKEALPESDLSDATCWLLESALGGVLTVVMDKSSL